MRGVQIRALVITMHYSLAQGKKVGKTLTDVKITAVETKTVCKILGNVQVEPPAETSPETLSQVVAKTIANTLTCVKAKAPVKNRR